MNGYTRLALAFVPNYIFYKAGRGIQWKGLEIQSLRSDSVTYRPNWILTSFIYKALITGNIYLVHFTFQYLKILCMWRIIQDRTVGTGMSCIWFTRTSRVPDVFQAPICIGWMKERMCAQTGRNQLPLPRWLPGILYGLNTIRYVVRTY